MKQQVILLLMAICMQQLDIGDAAPTVKIHCSVTPGKSMTMQYRVIKATGEPYYKTVGYVTTTKEYVDSCAVDSLDGTVLTKTLTFDFTKTPITSSDPNCDKALIKTKYDITKNRIQWSIITRGNELFDIPDQNFIYTYTCDESNLNTLLTISPTFDIADPVTTVVATNNKAKLILVDAATYTPLGSPISAKTTQKFRLAVIYQYKTGTYPAGSYPITCWAGNYYVYPGTKFGHAKMLKGLDSKGCQEVGSTKLKAGEPFYTLPFAVRATAITGQAESGYTLYQLISDEMRVATFAEEGKVVTFSVEIGLCYTSIDKHCVDTRNFCASSGKRRKRESSVSGNTTTLSSSYIIEFGESNSGNGAIPSSLSPRTDDCPELYVFWIGGLVLGLFLIMTIVLSIYLFSRLKKERELRSMQNYRKGVQNIAY